MSFTTQLQGFYRVQTYGFDSTFMRALTHRYVNGELRFLTLTHRGDLHEFRLPSAFGGTQEATTAQWNLSSTGALNDHSGLWFEQAKNRLWVTSGPDYTASYVPGKVTILTLNSNGGVTVVKQFFLSIPGKRAYGGVSKVPASLVSKLGGEYVVGWGGYTSLIQQGGNASLGPAMYAIPNPDNIGNGTTVTVRTVLDATRTGPVSAGERGVRKTIPQNYFDGGDVRQNPPTRPTVPPATSGEWLSPNAQGLGWMVWGDSYYNTGMWIGETFAAVMSGAKGSAWYESSTLAFDGRQFELHQWEGANLGTNILQRPDRMDEIVVPVGNSRVWYGNVPPGNLTGATFDDTTNTIYMIGWPFDAGDYMGRLYAFSVSGGSTPPANTTSSSSSSSTSASSSASPSRTASPSVSSSSSRSTSSSSSSSPSAGPTPEPTDPDIMEQLDDIQTLAEQILEAVSAPELATFNATVTGVSTYTNGDRRLTVRVPLTSMPTAPVNGKVLRVLKD